jgi:hypothetical protein
VILLLFMNVHNISAMQKYAPLHLPSIL